MLAFPRRVIRAGLPRLSRSWTLGTVKRSASHALFAPEAAIVSAVITRPALGAFDCAIPALAPPPAAATHRSRGRPHQKREGRSMLRPLAAPLTARPSVHDRIGHDVLHRIHR